MQDGQGNDCGTMMAVVTTGTGGYDTLEYKRVPMPVAGPGEVLLKVLAAGVNNTEITTRLGKNSSSVTDATADTSDAELRQDGGWNKSTPFPVIQGTDCSGKVVAVGTGCDANRIGQRVVVRSCMRVLVPGASGGVGSALVQLLSRRDAEVIAVTRAAKHA